MAKQLTEAQREAKRARDKAYRERKAAESLGPVLNADGSPSDVTVQMLTGRTGKLKKLEDLKIVSVEIVNAGVELPAFEVNLGSEFTKEQLATEPGATEAFLSSRNLDLSAKQLEALAATLSGFSESASLFEVEAIAEAILYRDQIRAAKVGDYVTTPRGGMPGYVHKRFRDGGVFVTGDGGNKEGGGWCPHVNEPDFFDTATKVYYEVIDGQWAGQHGWLHRARGCNRVYQEG